MATDYLLNIEYNRFDLAELITITFPADLTLAGTDCMSWESSQIVLSKCILDTSNNILYAFIDQSQTYLSGALNLLIKTRRNAIVNPAAISVVSTGWAFKVRTYGGQDSHLNAIDASTITT